MQKFIIHSFLFLGLAFLIGYFILILEGEDYYLLSLCIIALVLISFFILLEKKIRLRDILIIVIMSSIAVVSRIAFFFLPQVKPMAAFVIITGAALGPISGFAAGVIAAFLSNFYFGQGPYTPFQMTALGLLGYLAGVFFSRHKENKAAVILFGILATTVLYGGIVDLNTIFLLQKSPTWEFVCATYLVALPMNLIHGISTGLFLFLLYHPILKKILRIQKKYGIN